MPEAVRLVVWDLDETFWSGTLTEGGISYQRSTHDIVIELARRGIMSSICSKNDFEQVKAILEREGIWDYFIFPSINWQPKGPRIAALIESVQLRPETVMVIDDNPMNLNEATFFTPSIQVSDEKIIGGIVDNPLFKGKDDSELTRLKQYKLLERRSADAATSSDNMAFLRESQIRISIEVDIEKHIDRTVELINRTNQLNFTKRRLPEDPEKAREALRRWLSHFVVQAGLIRVSDRYGDYGFCGFYGTIINGARAETGRPRPALMYYCFSCRILGMGVEAFVYEMLGRPLLRIAGEVLSDPINDGPVDWISLVDGEARRPAAGNAAARRDSDRVFLRGGCDLQILAQYCGRISAHVHGEYNLIRNGLPLRTDHSLITRYAVEGVSEQAMKVLERIGYVAEDFTSALTSHKPSAVILSLIPDSWLSVYRHNETGLLFPFFAGHGLHNAVHGKPTAQQAEQIAANPKMRESVDFLREECSFVGYTPEADFKDSLTAILCRVPPTVPVFTLLRKEHYGTDRDAAAKFARRYNDWTREVAANFANVRMLPMMDFVQSDSEIDAGNHFHRLVYFRLFERIKGEIEGRVLPEPRADISPAGAPGTRDSREARVRVPTGAP